MKGRLIFEHEDHQIHISQGYKNLFSVKKRYEEPVFWDIETSGITTRSTASVNATASPINWGVVDRQFNQMLESRTRLEERRNQQRLEAIQRRREEREAELSRLMDDDIPF